MAKVTRTTTTEMTEEELGQAVLRLFTASPDDDFLAPGEIMDDLRVMGIDCTLTQMQCAVNKLFHKGFLDIFMTHGDRKSNFGGMEVRFVRTEESLEDQNPDHDHTCSDGCDHRATDCGCCDAGGGGP